METKIDNLEDSINNKINSLNNSVDFKINNLREVIMNMNRR